MNREQFDRESEELSLVRGVTGAEVKLNQLQKEMELGAGCANYYSKDALTASYMVYDRRNQAMRNVVNDPAFQKQMAAQMRAMPLVWEQPKRMIGVQGILGGGI